MDQVEQDRPAAGLPAPAAAGLEVVVRLVEQRGTHHGHHRPRAPLRTISRALAMIGL